MKSSHFNKKGQARIVDISKKKITKRIAIATGKVFMNIKTLEMIEDGNHKKGDVLAIARISGILACKKTSSLIPLCHPLNIEFVELNFNFNKKESFIEIECQCKTTNKTGIEIEALTGVTIAGLTIYDMCKSVDRSMRITEVKLNHKSGGKSGEYNSL